MEMFILNGDSGKVVWLLGRMGPCEYEAKAYFTLLLMGESKAWDLSLASSVPQSRIYHVLYQLMDKGLVKSNCVFPMRVRALKMPNMDRALRRMLKSLMPYREKLNAHVRVFEPSYRRRG